MDINPLSGQGEAGRNGGPSGDLYVAFRVLPHDFFIRDGYDLRCENSFHSLSGIIRAVEVPTLNGKVVEDSGRNSIRD